MFAINVRSNGHCLYQFLCWFRGESLYPEGGHSTLGWNDLGTLEQNDRGSFYSGGHSTLRQRYYPSKSKNKAVLRVNYGDGGTVVL